MPARNRQHEGNGIPIRHPLVALKHLGLYDAESRSAATQPYQDTTYVLAQTNHEHAIAMAPYIHAFAGSLLCPSWQILDSLGHPPLLVSPDDLYRDVTPHAQDTRRMLLQRTESLCQGGKACAKDEKACLEEPSQWSGTVRLRAHDMVLGVR